MSETRSKATIGTSEELGIREDLFDQFPENLRTRYTEIDVRCPKCQNTWPAAVAVVVNAKTHPVVREGILRKTMHHGRCPICKQFERDIDQIWDYYDPEENIIIQCRPKWEYKAGGEEDAYFSRLEWLVEKYQDVDVRVDVVFGLDEFIEKYLGGEKAREAALKRREKERELGLISGTIREDNQREFGFTE